MHKYTSSQCDFRREKSVMGIWFSNLVELIKIKVAVSCVNWELQVNLVVGLGKGGFCAGELLPLVESRHAGAVRRSRKHCCFWDNSAWGTVWNLGTHTHTDTHKPDPVSMENIPALWVLRQETWLAAKKAKSLPSQSLVIIALCSLISLAILKSLYSADLGVLKRQSYLKPRNRTGYFQCPIQTFVLLVVSFGFLQDKIKPVLGMTDHRWIITMLLTE